MSKSLATWFTPSLQTISRAKGRSATAAAAYRACVKLADKLTGVIHDYRAKRGHVETILIGATNIAQLWNDAEAAEKRKDSTVARELMLPLPDQWTDNERRECVRDIAQHLRNTYGVAVASSIHAASKHDRNNHVHMMFTTRIVDEHGVFGKKTRILDEGLKNGEIKNLREAICKIVNEHAERLNSDFYVYAGKFSDIDLSHIPQKHIPIQAGKGYREFVTTQNVQIKIYNENSKRHQKKAELLKAELSSALVEEIAEKTAFPNGPKTVDVLPVEANTPKPLDNGLTFKITSDACEKAMSTYRTTLKNQSDLMLKKKQIESIKENWKSAHQAELVAFLQKLALVAMK